MKIALISSRFNETPYTGDQVILHNRIRHSSKNNEIHLISYKINGNNKVKSNLYELHEITPPSKINRIINILHALISVKPLTNAYSTNQNFYNCINKIISENSIDLVIVILTRNYSKLINHDKIIIDCIDNLSLNYREIASSLSLINPKKYLYKYEETTAKRFEYCINDKIPKLFVNYQESLNSVGLYNHYLPLGVNNYNNSNKTIIKFYDFVFGGNLSYEPNKKAAEKIILLLERLTNKIKFNLLITGKGSPDFLIKYKNKYEWITILTDVNSITDLYNSSKIFIAPMEYGTGIQNKVLEAMSVGIPCILSKKIASPLNLLNGVNCFICENDQDYLSASLNLFKNDSLRKLIGDEGQKFVRVNHNWDKINEKLDNIISSYV